MRNKSELETEVLIVGAGPAGLALAIELGMRNRKVIVVERNERVGLAPRAKTTNVRTRTHLRRWGIADKLAAEAPFGVEYPNTMVFVTALHGYELARFDDAFNASPERSPLYPEHGQWVPQYKLEAVLLQHAQSLPSVDIRFSVTFKAASQDAHQVSSTIVDATGVQTTISSQYLVGADGARSKIRESIGAKMVGRSGLSHSYNIIFRAPGLGAEHSHGPAAVYWQFGGKGFSAIGPMDKNDIWFFGPGGIQPGQTLSNDEARKLIHERTGINIPFEILSADSWTASDLIADRYFDKRIFLVGDACHLHPPYGGYGMNMGVGDGVDLGWKIAATLEGWGGPELLESYETERRPVHRFVIDEAVANHAITVEKPPAMIEDDSPEGAALRKSIGERIQNSKGREFHTLGTVLGLGYVDSPVIAHESSPLPPHNGSVYTPTARPGFLAPHAWLSDGNSLYDLFGDGFTLIADKHANTDDIRQAEADAISQGIPLKVVRAPNIDLATLYGAKIALVRPDQHVAWRGDNWTNPFSLVTGWSASVPG